MYRTRTLQHRLASPNAFHLIELSIGLIVLITLAVGTSDIMRVLQAKTALKEGVRASLRCLYPVNGDCVTAPASGSPEAYYHYYKPEPGTQSFVNLVKYSGYAEWLEKPILQTTGATVQVLSGREVLLPVKAYGLDKLYYAAEGKVDYNLMIAGQPDISLSGSIIAVVHALADVRAKIAARSTKALRDEERSLLARLSSHRLEFNFTLPDGREYPIAHLVGIRSGNDISNINVVSSDNGHHSVSIPFTLPAPSGLKEGAACIVPKVVGGKVVPDFNRQCGLAANSTGSYISDPKNGFAQMVMFLKGHIKTLATTTARVSIKLVTDRVNLRGKPQVNEGDDDIELGGQLASGTEPSNFIPRGIISYSARDMENGLDDIVDPSRQADDSSRYSEFTKYAGKVKIYYGVPYRLIVTINREQGSGSVAWSGEELNLYPPSFSPGSLIRKCDEPFLRSHGSNIKSCTAHLAEGSQLLVMIDHPSLALEVPTNSIRTSIATCPVKEEDARAELSTALTRGDGTNDVTGDLALDYRIVERPELRSTCGPAEWATMPPCPENKGSSILPDDSVDSSIAQSECPAVSPIAGVHARAARWTIGVTKVSFHTPVTWERSTCNITSPQTKPEELSQFRSILSYDPPTRIGSTVVNNEGVPVDKFLNHHPEYQCLDGSAIGFEKKQLSTDETSAAILPDSIRQSLLYGVHDNMDNCSEEYRAEILKEQAIKYAGIIPSAFFRFSSQQTGFRLVNDKSVNSCTQIQSEEGDGVERKDLGVHLESNPPTECANEGCIKDFAYFSTSNRQSSEGSHEHLAIEIGTKAVQASYPRAVSCSNGPDCVTLKVTPHGDSYEVSGDLDVPLMILGSRKMPISYSESHRSEQAFMR